MNLWNVVSKTSLFIFSLLSMKQVNGRLNTPSNNVKNIDDYYNPPTNKNTCNILALSGGGSFGAVEVGILDDLISKNEIPTTYDTITGISAGGLNAGFLSYYKNITDAIPLLKQMYSQTKTDNIYKRELLKIFKTYAIYDTTPLRNTLVSFLENKTPINGGTHTLVGASNINELRLDVFDFNAHTFEDKIQILLSTSAIPLAFPMQEFNGSYYVDGGVISNEMIYQALGERANCEEFNVVFISASSHKTNQKTPSSLVSYIESIYHLLMSTFDYQIASMNQNKKCPNPLGSIKACFPDKDKLDSFSILDFDNGLELYNIGKQYYSCNTIPLC
jgi:predicted acylesterase/phospholipase RssA